MGRGRGAHIGEVAPDSASLPLQHYRKGVIKATPTTCDPIQVNHSVLLVGFGKTKSVEGRQGKAALFGSYSRPRCSMAYWTLKNSWGTHWGEKVSVIYWGQTGRTDLSPLSDTDGP